MIPYHSWQLLLICFLPHLTWQQTELSKLSRLIWGQADFSFLRSLFPQMPLEDDPFGDGGMYKVVQDFKRMVKVNKVKAFMANICRAAKIWRMILERLFCETLLELFLKIQQKISIAWIITISYSLFKLLML